MGKAKLLTMVSDKTSTGVASAVVLESLGTKKSFQMIGNTTAGAGAAEIEVQASNDGTNWVILDTLTLTLGTTVTSDFFEHAYPWKQFRGSVKSISGTGAKVSLIAAVQL